MTDLCQSIFFMLVFPPPPLPETFKAIFVCVLMKMERREEELHLFLKKKALLLACIYMNMIFETWLFQQDRIQRDVSQLRGPQTRKLHGVHTSFISVCHIQWG